MTECSSSRPLLVLMNIPPARTLYSGLSAAHVSRTFVVYLTHLPLIRTSSQAGASHKQGCQLYGFTIILCRILDLTKSRCFPILCSSKLHCIPAYNARCCPMMFHNETIFFCGRRRVMQMTHSSGPHISRKHSKSHFQNSNMTECSSSRPLLVLMNIPPARTLYSGLSAAHVSRTFVVYLTHLPLIRTSSQAGASHKQGCQLYGFTIILCRILDLTKSRCFPILCSSKLHCIPAYNARCCPMMFHNETIFFCGRRRVMQMTHSSGPHISPSMGVNATGSSMTSIGITSSSSKLFKFTSSGFTTKYTWSNRVSFKMAWGSIWEQPCSPALLQQSLVDICSRHPLVDVCSRHPLVDICSRPPLPQSLISGMPKQLHQ